MGNDLIRIEHLSKEYGNPRDSSSRIVAFEDISLSVSRQEFYTIIGPSGCGKSTLLNIVAGLVRASSGQVIVDGKLITGPLPKIIAVVFQDANLMPWRNVIDNVAFGRELLGQSKAERRKIASEMLELVGLAGFEKRYPHELSGGMAQRVSIARALTVDPDILLMDEPFGALDEQTRLLLGKELLSIWEKTRKTVLFVTHSLTEASYLSDRVAIMTARPAKVKRIIKIDIPRPRQINNPKINEYRDMIWDLISEESLKALAGSKVIAP